MSLRPRAASQQRREEAAASNGAQIRAAIECAKLMNEKFALSNPESGIGMPAAKRAREDADKNTLRYVFDVEVDQYVSPSPSAGTYESRVIVTLSKPRGRTYDQFPELLKLRPVLNAEIPGFFERDGYQTKVDFNKVCSNPEASSIVWTFTKTISMSAEEYAAFQANPNMWKLPNGAASPGNLIKVEAKSIKTLFSGKNMTTYELDQYSNEGRKAKFELRSTQNRR